MAAKLERWKGCRAASKGTRRTAYFLVVLQTVALHLLASFGHRCNAAILAVQIHERTAGSGEDRHFLFIWSRLHSNVILPVRRFFERYLGYTKHLLCAHTCSACLWAVLFVGGIFSSGSFLKRDELRSRCIIFLSTFLCSSCLGCRSMGWLAWVAFPLPFFSRNIHRLASYNSNSTLFSIQQRPGRPAQPRRGRRRFC